MWDKIKFLVEKAKTIVFALFVVWIMTMLTLMMSGVIVEADCPACWGLLEKVVDKVISSAEASQVLTDVPAESETVFRVRLSKHGETQAFVWATWPN